MKPFFESCLHLQESLGMEGVKQTYCIVSDSAVHRGRNQLVKAFLESDFDRLMFIDSDIEFSADDVGKLWNLDADIAVGVYPMKEMGAPYAAWVDGKLIDNLEQFSGPVNVDYAGTGFMMIKRSVFEALMPFTPLEKCLEADKKTEGFRYVFFDFPLMPVDSKDEKAIRQTETCSKVVTELPEDYGFCQKARQLGFKVQMDPTVKLKHFGLYGYGS
jgi:hypothetical protein